MQKRNQFLEIGSTAVSDKRAKSTVKYISSIYATTKCFVYAEIYKVTLFKFKLLGKRNTVHMQRTKLIYEKDALLRFSLVTIKTESKILRFTQN